MQATEPVTIEQLKALREQGKTEEALKAIEQRTEYLGSFGTDPATSGEMLYQDELKELAAEKAWNHYRRKEYPACRNAIERAGGYLPGGNRKARECLAQLAAYVDKNDTLLMTLLEELGVSLASCNALMIRARDADSSVKRQTVLNNVFGFRENKDVVSGHIMHNGARYFIAKPKDDADLFFAIGLLECALERYGEGDVNLHHRGAALFWKSKVMQTLLGREAARTPARESRELWKRQLALDPTNPAYLTGVKNSEARCAELDNVAAGY